ncbi:MAG: PH domain-containing protein [Lachnospiraceae bacterium]|nr:PH domain-containing protein [Lachnospiraceae bacterium]
MKIYGNSVKREDGAAMEYVEKKRVVLFAMPLSFTTYIVKEDILTVDTGFMNKTENDCYMYKIQDVRLTTTLFERIFGLGTISCFTGDVTDKTMVLSHIKNAKEIKDFILKASEEARRKRRTLNTLDIGADKRDLDDGE